MSRTPLTRLAARVLTVLGAAALTLALLPAVAVQAHGSTIDPASRNYGCWQRWGSDFQNPAMATEDPMCWQAWQADPNAMWNWNGLYRRGRRQPPGRHPGRAAVQRRPDRRRPLQRDGHRRATGRPPTSPTTSRVKLHDQARHGADLHPGLRHPAGLQPADPAAELERPGTGQPDRRNAPAPAAPSRTRCSTASPINIAASAPGRTGRHIVYTIWQASPRRPVVLPVQRRELPAARPRPRRPPPTHAPADHPAAATTPPPTTPTADHARRRPPRRRPAPAPPPTPCSAQWPGGFQGEVQVTAGAAAIRGWTVTWTLANGQTIELGLERHGHPAGSAVTARNVGYNGASPPAPAPRSASSASWNGTNTVPTLTCTPTPSPPFAPTPSRRSWS